MVVRTCSMQSCILIVAQQLSTAPALSLRFGVGGSCILLVLPYGHYWVGGAPKIYPVQTDFWGNCSEGAHRMSPQPP